MKDILKLQFTQCHNMYISIVCICVSKVKQINKFRKDRQTDSLCVVTFSKVKSFNSLVEAIPVVCFDLMGRL